MSEVVLADIMGTVDFPNLDQEDVDGCIITSAFVILVRQHPEWHVPRPIFVAMKGMSYEEQIGLLTSVLDKVRADNVTAWETG